MHSTVKKVKPKRIDPDKWYIVDCYLIRLPYLLWNEFKSEKRARIAKFRYLADDKRYSVTSGKNALKHEIPFYWDLIFTRRRHRYKMIHWFATFKYNYDKMPPHFRKQHYREMIRRHKKQAQKHY